MDALLLIAPEFLAHDPGEGHPERPSRLAAVLADLEARPIAGLCPAIPRRARATELARVHAPEHLARVAATAGRRAQLDPDTRTSPLSHDAALLAAGAVALACEEVVEGRASGAFALVRPPGHHAERDRAMGFCLFNNVAVAAAHAVTELSCRRVLVADPDVHHGNGTQRAFWTRRDVLFVSSHQYPFYPGTGAVDEIGGGGGEGFTVNLPLPAGSGDADLLHVWREVAGPVVESFEPDLVVVSAGFDAWHADPLGGLRVTARGFDALFGLFAAWARKHAHGRLVLALEGGYDPEGLAVGVRSALGTLVGASPPRDPDEDDATLGPVSSAVAATSARSRRLLSPWWPALL